MRRRTLDILFTLCAIIVVAPLVIVIAGALYAIVANAGSAGVIGIVWFAAFIGMLVVAHMRDNR